MQQFFTNPGAKLAVARFILCSLPLSLLTAEKSVCFHDACFRSNVRADV